MKNDFKKHPTENLSGGGFVLALNPEAKIDGQAEAMLQALHSRSTGGIFHHLKVLEEKGAENFMDKFYVGYGHKSIGDCGSVTVFVEGVSMLAAKAIQDWRLYSGQEASTRYVDFYKQKFFNPINSSAGDEILESWREFYLKIQKPASEHLKNQFPKDENENEKIYEKAILARTFDIARAFLPAGATTNLAWRMNFRQFADQLMLLRHHPLLEVREVAEKTEQVLQQLYPESFGQKKYEKTENYNDFLMKENYYLENEKADDFQLIFDNVNREILGKYKNVLQERPEKTELPNQIGECGVLSYEFLLDFGSFRDLQRHRALVQRMPLLTKKHGFNQWYLDSLPEKLKIEARDFLQKQEEKIEKLKISKEEKQYFIPMGYKVPCRFVGDLKALTYLVELRATRFVHPTLVCQILKLAKDFENRFSKFGLKLYLDDEPNRFDSKRGEQDIVEK